MSRLSTYNSALLTSVLLSLVLSSSSSTAARDVLQQQTAVVTSSTDLDLIKLYLEEFRLELLSIKSQLVRMARNSKLLRTSLKALRSANCNHNREVLDYANVECPLGFQLSSPSSCYKFVRDRVNWGEAQARCAALNAHLVALETHSEQRFIKHHLTHTRKLQNCDYWTAGTDQQEEGEWLWNTTSSAGGVQLATPRGRSARISRTSHNWNVGEPNNSNGDENCLLLDWFADWSWNDASCRAQRACYVCEVDM